MEEAVNSIIAKLYEQENERLDAIRRHQEAQELKRREEEIKALAYDKLRIEELEKCLHNGYRLDAYNLIFNPYEYYSSEYTDQNNIINKTLRSHYVNNEKYKIEFKYEYAFQRDIEKAVQSGHWNIIKYRQNDIIKHCPENLKPYFTRLVNIL